MIKHGVVMVTLLILTLSLLGVASASEDITASDVESELSINHENTQIEIVNNEEQSTDDTGIDDSVSVEEGDELLGDTLKSEYSISSDYENEIGQFDYEIDSNQLDYENGIGQFDYDLNDVVNADAENDISISQDNLQKLSKAIGNDLNDNNYEYGFNVTQAANELYDFNSADEIIAIVSVSEDEINSVTTENVLNGIIDASNGYVTYRKGNLLKLSSIESGLINIAFFIKKGEFLTMAFYNNRNMASTYSGNVGPENSAGLWRELEKSLSGDDDCFNVFSLSNGLSNDVLTLCESEKYDSTGLIFGQEMIQTLLEYNLNSDETGLPLDDAEKRVIGVSDDSDVNAFIWSSPDENACVSVDSNEKSINGLIVEDSTSQSRMITMLSYDQSNYKEIAENNFNPDGTVKDETQSVKSFNALTPEDIKQIGIDASKKALAYFESQGIDINKHYQNFYILTSAGSVKVNGLDTKEAIDGILEVFGYKISENLISIDTPLWKDLVFYFLWVNGENNDIISYGLEYIAETGKLVESNTVKEQGDAIAYELGLYGKNPIIPTPKHHKSHYCNVNGGFYVAGEQTSLGNLNNTNTTNSTNSTSLNNTIKKSNPKKVAKKPESTRNPYNIVYTLGAICIVFILFGATYLKR